MSNALNPQPATWPTCGDCGVAYVLRRGIVVTPKGKRMSLDEKWVWQRDCKHKKAEIKIKVKKGYNRVSR